ncbi:2-amino-4-hydroxy-6-hydroxymethyldihydropteridine pyrophosphokinase [Paenibacillus baekrokdamisoli]|uniref:2-amino-4-hydroxy-6-hydroxymethyldihydropteridine diphosphokinase n=1 Tax=Paenibacillus baekrokdamisoli TaxID=1712516 RepID=A0A3G9JEB6_9BACL|nr:2-amino-4-hydroxy-6-hydroxymethyldihydropteridine diphosphokinase [Paenibacillus baekrokdamisoli]MBB3073021.1 2-amino-4-hydroxy-6-hydroxymethyldihydropteridine diphosphokinase [Paenibacillus baekrokdamisoli]BBH23313.1 2-amino-4-hydroxy-6-hydroxymethyldihydropteridine pyrophosphokinase [Paenibacillus baekrokdamisoli]
MNHSKNATDSHNEDQTNTEPTDAYIALGSNVGDRERLLHEALLLIDRHPAIQVTRISGIYETDPVGYTDQPAFLNMTAALSTTLAPIELLHVLLEFEQQLGRTRDIRWGPRTIDLDLLLMADVQMDEEVLTLPHPRMMERAFVLVPLHEVLSSGHPLQEQVNQIAVRALKDGEEGIALWNTINWPGASAHSAN